MEFKIAHYQLDNIFERCQAKLAKEENKDR